MSKHPPPLLETERLLLSWPTPEQIDGYYAAITGTSADEDWVYDAYTNTIVFENPPKSHTLFSEIPAQLLSVFADNGPILRPQQTSRLKSPVSMG